MLNLLQTSKSLEDINYCLKTYKGLITPHKVLMHLYRLSSHELNSLQLFVQCFNNSSFWRSLKAQMLYKKAKCLLCSEIWEILFLMSLLLYSLYGNRLHSIFLTGLNYWFVNTLIRKLFLLGSCTRSKIIFKVLHLAINFRS